MGCLKLSLEQRQDCHVQYICLASTCVPPGPDSQGLYYYYKCQQRLASICRCALYHSAVARIIADVNDNLLHGQALSICRQGIEKGS